MAEKIKLYDDAKCTACRGCQLACKQWNALKAGQTKQWGSYQNPPTLQPNNYMIIHFQDVKDDKGGVKWLFRKEACMHCTEAACVTVCPSGALYYNKDFGTVGLNRDLCIGCKNCTAACPFEVPKYDAGTDKVFKCDMCESRLANNMTPACVKACPTGALSWGDKEAQMKKAAARVQQLGGVGHRVRRQIRRGHAPDVRALREARHLRRDLQIDPCVPLSITLWKGFLKPVSLLAAGGILVGSFLHYLIHGPKLPDDAGDAGKKEGGE